MEEEILISSAGQGIAVITLNRPEKRNAMNEVVIQKITDALQRLAADPKTRVLILEASGEHFCSGADINNMQRIAQVSREENIEDAMRLATMLHELNYFPHPTIALAKGNTLGGGMGILACCDMVIADTDAHFGFSETKIGLTPSTISPYVVAAIGERAARYYFLTAEKFDAHEAHRIHLVTQVVEPDALGAAGLTLAYALMKNSPHAMSEAKKLIDRVSNQPISQELMQFTAEHLASMRSSSEAQEGLKAFLEKRSAVWG